MKFLTFSLLVGTLILLVVKQVKSESDCSAVNKGCIWDEPNGRNESNCHTNYPTCFWCPNELLRRRCQTTDRSCLVNEKWEFPDLSKEACESEGHVYCDGYKEKICICSEPIDKICYTPGPATLIPCANPPDPPNEKSCNEAGCIWCREGIGRRLNNCWAYLTNVTCPDDEPCCKAKRCLDGHYFDEDKCKEKGCHICHTKEHKKLCIYGKEPQCPNGKSCCEEKRCGDDGITTKQCIEMGCHMCCLDDGTKICNLGPNPNPGLCNDGGLDCQDPEEYPNEDKCRTDTPQCLWCEDFSNAKKCQTTDFACLVDPTWIMPGDLNKDVCEAEGGVFCRGDCEQMCICPDRAHEICYDPKGSIPCRTEETNKKGCQELGCVWCGDKAIYKRKNKCWRMPCEFGCKDKEETCCKEKYCMPGYDPDEDECEDMGCHICEDEYGNKLCNFPSFCPNEEVCCKERRCGKKDISKSECEDLGCHMCCDKDDNIWCNFGEDPNPGTCVDSEAAYDCIKGQTKNEENCKLVPQCLYCRDLTYSRRCQTTDPSCLVKERWLLHEYTTEDSCEDNDGVFCNGDYKEQCICSEPADKFCFTIGKDRKCFSFWNIKSCQENGCLWCGVESFPNRRGGEFGIGRCWLMPAEATCDDGYCCKKRRCMDGYNPDEVACTERGCVLCDKGNLGKLCVFPFHP